MTRSNGLGWIRILTASAALLSPLGASAAPPRASTVQPAAAAQIVLAAALLPHDSEANMVEVVPNGAVLYRFTLEIVTLDGRPCAAAFWEATVFVVGSGMRAELVRLSAGRHEVSLPRPLGFSVVAGDSLGVRVRLSCEAGDSVHLRLVAEYEPLQLRFSRFPAVAAPAFPETSRTLTSGSVSWLWETPVSGWLLALSGMDHVAGGELILQDAESGALIWRHLFDQPVSGTAETASAVILVGTTVQAGRSYRLIVTSAAAAGFAAEPVHALQAMVLPTPTVALRSNGN
jgi:hypothetical protein